MAEAAPIITVVIPTYNRMDIVRRAIRSVLAQTYLDYEILLVDDGSTDPIHQLMDEFPQIRIVRHETNQGEGAARNTGVREGRGKWVAYLDSDDEWLPEKLQRQMDYLSAHPELKGCGSGNINVFPDYSEEFRPIDQQNWYHHFAAGADLGAGATFIGLRECMLEFEYDVNFPRLVDLDWLLRFTKKYPIGVVSEPLAIVYRSGSPKPELVEISNIRLVSRHGADWLKLGRFYGSQCIGKRWLEVAVHYYRAGDRAKGARYLWKAVMTNPIQRPGMYLRILDSLLKTNIHGFFKKSLSS